MLANKYRPQQFSDVVGQDVCIKILEKQIQTNTYSNALLFSGNAGCGKTTCAKIFANKINGELYEIDCASHNGVADVKEILENARLKPLVMDYKVFILDEAQTLSQQAWSSMLITLEEKIPTSIFIFCTTDPQKIPNTIMSRVQRFNFLPIVDAEMLDRLHTICANEQIQISDEALSYIIKSANGNLRQALTNLDKCLLYEDLSKDGVCHALNIVSYNLLGDICQAYKINDTEHLIKLVELVYNNGYELSSFVKQLLDYCLSKDRNISLIQCLLTILQDIRYDDCPKNLIIAHLITGGM